MLTSATAVCAAHWATSESGAHCSAAPVKPMQASGWRQAADPSCAARPTHTFSGPSAARL